MLYRKTYVLQLRNRSRRVRRRSHADSRLDAPRVTYAERALLHQGNRAGPRVQLEASDGRNARRLLGDDDVQQEIVPVSCYLCYQKDC